MIWFTSDMHYGHEGVIKYCKRPFINLKEMEDTLTNNWCKKINSNDTVYVLGDMCLGKYSEYKEVLSLLPGKKILIRGNHDGWSEGQYNKLGFTVYHELKLKLLGKMVRLSHYPYTIPWWKRWNVFPSELRYMDRRPPRIEDEYLLHGHTHKKYKRRDNMIHVGVDAWNFKPVSLNEIASLLDKL